MVLRVLQFGQYAALFQFSTDSNERQGRSWHSNTYYIIWRCQKKKKTYNAQEHHFISNRKFGWVLETLSERKEAEQTVGDYTVNNLFAYW